MGNPADGVNSTDDVPVAEPDDAEDTDSNQE